MTLAGGALVVLDPALDHAAVEAFLQRNGIAWGRFTELDYVADGCFIETEPGFPSLELADPLAEQDGVELSSPNWGVEHTTR